MKEPQITNKKDTKHKLKNKLKTQRNIQVGGGDGGGGGTKDEKVQEYPYCSQKW